MTSLKDHFSKVKTIIDSIGYPVYYNSLVNPKTGYKQEEYFAFTGPVLLVLTLDLISATDNYQNASWTLNIYERIKSDLDTLTLLESILTKVNPSFDPAKTYHKTGTNIEVSKIDLNVEESETKLHHQVSFTTKFFLNQKG